MTLASSYYLENTITPQPDDNKNSTKMNILQVFLKDMSKKYCSTEMLS